jgi:hypothetical protein
VDIFSETEREQGPSWARDNWPLTDLDEVNAGLDPTRMTIEKVAARAKEAAGSAGKSEAEIRQAAEDSIRAMMLIRTYRVRGHLAADLDPLGLAKRELPADLTPEYHGFTGAALDRPVYLSAARWASKRPPCASSSSASAAIIAGISASNICTSTIWRSDASFRIEWRASTPRSTSPRSARSRSCRR